MGARGPIPDPKKQTGRLGRPVRPSTTTTVRYPTGDPEPPATLGTVGQSYWASYIDAPWITPPDYRALERLCLLNDELDEYSTVVSREGALVPGSKAQPVAHPLLAVIDKLRTSVERLEIELGLTPMARQRMHIRVAPEPRHTKLDRYIDPYAHLREDPLAEFLAGDPEPRSAKERFGQNGHKP